MANTVVRLLSIVLLCITTAQGRKNFHPNSEWSTSSSVINHVDGICQTMVETQGYTCEEHMVTTEDGYILSLQRLPAGRSGKKVDKPPVLLQHGLFSDAITWLVNCPNESLGFILADNGYDVWLANTRGTKYSRGHRSFNPNDMAYWDWSWDELARYDLPAFVKYVYNHTGQRMHYAGHSLGTLMALAAFSQGQVLDTLRSAALLSPIAHMHQVTSPVAKLAADTFIANLNILLMCRDAAGKFVEGICNSLNLNCSNLLALFTGPNRYMNSSTLNVFLDHGVESTATMNLIHLCQKKNSKTIVIGLGVEDTRSSVPCRSEENPRLISGSLVSHAGMMSNIRFNVGSLKITLMFGVENAPKAKMPSSIPRPLAVPPISALEMPRALKCMPCLDILRLVGNVDPNAQR
ncbi:Triacylglycerol lipase 2 [Spatholobus suberectus]|nr:Triacylglycerol lipase 2 [Spatholobus suberectus]